MPQHSDTLASLRPAPAVPATPPARPGESHPIAIVTLIREALVEAGVHAVIAGTADCEVVGAVRDLERLHDVLQATQPTVVVLDAAFNKQVPTLLAELTEAFPATRFVVMVEHSEEECVLGAIARAEGRGLRLDRRMLEHMGECCLLALRDGGRGCVPRGAPVSRLLETIRAVAAGEIAAGPWLAAEWVEGAAARVRHSRLASLSARELEVIRLVARGLGNKEIAAQLGIHLQTVKNHLGRIMPKLHVENRVELAMFAKKQRLA